MTRVGRHLQHIHAERYGGLARRDVGPFGAGLNVVYGPNEAGKSTLMSLVGGVLFGWEEAHGVRNRYRPPEGGRAGELVWCDEEAAPADRAAVSEGDPASSIREGASESVPALTSAAAPASVPLTCVRLVRDEDGVRGDAFVADDIDRETFETMFSFSSHDLRSLGNSSDVTARLLTATSGTESSPAGAFVEIERRIADATQRILQLGDQLEAARERVRRATDEAELYKQEDRELRELAAGRELAADKIDEANGELEDLIAGRTELETLDARAADLKAELESLTAERDEITARPNGQTTLDWHLLKLDSAGERVLRDRLDEYAEAQEKSERMLDTAKENSASSSAAYEALEEIGEGDAPRRATYPQVVISVILSIAFIAAGIPVFMHGREIASLSFTALGIGLVLFAIILAAVAVFVLLRPPKGESVLESRRQDARWVMLQDRKKLDSCLAERDQLGDEIAGFLAESGLGAAGGSIRQARSLLDEARATRAEIASNDQRLSSLEMRIRAGRQELAACEQRRREIASDAALHDASARGFDVLIRKQTERRDALVESSENMSQRFGELTRALDQAKRDNTFAMAKYDSYRIRAQLRTEKHRLVELLLAKRMLDRGIAAWEGLSQPAVYDHASRLLALITDGAWVRVTTSVTGSLVAVTSEGVERDPRHLSLGTCQQLYLALRIALLMATPEVGASIPVLADDILVHFDAKRRLGAARALAELACERQVIVFTCHRETVHALEQADPSLTRISM